MSTDGFEKAGLDALWEAVMVVLAFHGSDYLCVCECLSISVFVCVCVRVRASVS